MGEHRSIDGLIARLERVERELEELRAGEMPEPPARGVGGEVPVSRRRLLGLGGAAVAGAAGAALGAVPAGAAMGNLQFGEANDATTDTTSLTSTHGTRTLLVSNTGSGGGAEGTTTSTGASDFGVQGRATGTSGATFGVRGLTDSTSANAAGVRGDADGTSGATFGVRGVNSSETAGAAGVQGVASTTGATFGVHGLAQSTTDDATGVFGEAEAATGMTFGVLGTTASTTANAAGVRGESTGGSTFGVVGAGGSGIGLQGSGTRAPLMLVPSGITGAPTTGAHSMGEFSLDNTGTLFQCTAAGTPGTWRQVLHSFVNTLNQRTELTVSGALDAFAGRTTGSGTGVVGSSEFGTGVLGQSVSGTCLWAFPTGSAVHLRLTPGSASGPPSTGSQGGDFYMDSAGVLWQCTATGSPGTWKDITNQSGGGGPVLNLLATPVRIYDSRPGQLPATGPKTPLAVNEDRQIDATLNSSGVPISASAVLLNLAVTGTVGVGFLGVFRDGIAYPGNANINWSASNQNISNAVTTAVANNAKFRVHCGGNPTNIVLDVIGYYL